MLHPTELTVNPHDADTATIVLTSTARRFAHMSIYERHGRWHWRWYVHEGKQMSSTESFETAVDAALVAASIAHGEGIPTVLPQALQDELVAIWSYQGREKFQQGYDVSTCWNVHMRRAFVDALSEASETELMDRDLAAMRRSQHRYSVRISDADLAAAEAEPMETEWQR